MTTAAPTEPPPSERELKIAAALRRRRWILGSLGCVAALAALLCLCDHLGLFGYRGDDQRRFDGRTFAVLSIDGPTTLSIGADGRPEQIGLLGVAAANAALHDEARRVLNDRAAGRKVMLRLDGLTRRDRDGRLLAYVFVDDTTSLNEHLIRQGLARANRDTRHSHAGAFAAAEATARRKKLGLWAAGP